eukprot:jgi/Mesvir1/19703/Mv09966-RA.1
MDSMGASNGMSRSRGRPDDFDMFGGRAKIPRPMEDGNWVCEDAACANVNYPRRDKCNKCGRKRGAAGDLVVENYMRGVRTGMVGASPYAGAAGGMWDKAGANMWQQPAYDYQGGAVAAHSNQLGVPDADGRQAPLRAATEGKTLAEQLIAKYGALMSADPYADASECLAAATLWLQVMQRNRAMGVAAPPAAALGRSGGMGADASGYMVGYGGAGMGGMGMGIGTGMGGMGMGMGMGMGVGMGVGMGAGMGMGMGGVPSMGAAARGPLDGFLKSPATARLKDYILQPSEFLKEYGDPAAVMNDPRIRPVKGMNGNWECGEESCKNINFPRRATCHKCNKERSPEGNRIVLDYVRSLIARGGGDVSL